MKSVLILSLMHAFLKLSRNLRFLNMNSLNVIFIGVVPQLVLLGLHVGSAFQIWTQTWWEGR